MSVLWLLVPLGIFALALCSGGGGCNVKPPNPGLRRPPAPQGSGGRHR